MKKTLFFITALFSLFTLTACEKQPETVSLAGKTMGTTYHIKYISDHSLKLTSEQVQSQIDEILLDVNKKMSTYDPNSELSQFNQNKQAAQPIAISQDFAFVLNQSFQINQLTQGYFDVTVGPVVNLWGFGPEKRTNQQPSQEQIQQRQSWVGMDKLSLTQENNQYYLEKSIPELYIDLSAIAKGFGVDQVANYLESLNISHYLVEIGGEIRARGKNTEGQDWQIAIEKPTLDGSRAVQQIIPLRNLALATSGDYRNYFEENGQRFSHEIDPKTGYPVQHKLVSVTVLHPKSSVSDAMATAFFVMGEEKSMALAEEKQIPVYLIIKTDNGFEEKISSAFDQYLKTGELPKSDWLN